MKRLNVTKIMTYGQLCDFPKDILDVDGVSKKKMLKFQEYAKSMAKVSNAPALTSHCKYFNP